MNLQRKIDFAIHLLQSIPQDDGPIELSYSGGKDSDVILELAKMAGIPFEAIYKNTTIDPPGTIQHCRDNGVTILQPKMSFLEIMSERGMPARFRRFCCSVLKEYKVHNRAIQGIRRSESTRRAKRYKEPEECRVYSAKEKVRVYYPILEWTDDDVVAFIKDRNIRCAPVYYDEHGQFHVERRLGCLGCPLRSDVGLGEFEQYPYLLKAQIRAYQKYLDKYPERDFPKKINHSAYNGFYYRLFCKTESDYLTAMDLGLFPEIKVDTKRFLEEHFGIDLTI